MPPSCVPSHSLNFCRSSMAQALHAALMADRLTPSTVRQADSSSWGFKDSVRSAGTQLCYCPVFTGHLEGPSDPDMLQQALLLNGTYFLYAGNVSAHVWHLFSNLDASHSMKRFQYFFCSKIFYRFPYIS